MSDSGPRIDPLEVEEWGDDEYVAFGALLGVPGDKVPRAGSGRFFDPMKFQVVRVTARHPELARVYWTFNGHFLKTCSIPPRPRELVILRVAHRRQSAYEWGQHVIAGLEAGISEEEIEAVVRGNEDFTGLDRLVLEGADELLAENRLGEQTWTRLAAELTTHQMMDLIFMVGSYAMLATFFDSVQLDPEPDTAPLPPLQ
jgi:4-carboxymuconolactone decarboxylase